MGADHKGPLLAFVIVAVIAVILLVTSVRSQAAPGWIGRQIPASVVAVAPPTTPGFWSAAGSHLEQAVRDGAVLAKKAVTHRPPAPALVVSVSSTTPDPHAGSSSHGFGHNALGGHTHVSRRPRPIRHAGPHRHATAPHHESDAGDDGRPGDGHGHAGHGHSSSAQGHGHHVGWGHAHHAHAGHDHHGHGHDHHGHGHDHHGHGHDHHGHGHHGHHGHAERGKHRAHSWG